MAEPTGTPGAGRRGSRLRAAAGRLLGVVGVLLALGLVAPVASAHEGPPFPILVDDVDGPWSLSVWADPDVGVGSFWVQLQGDAMPTDTVVEIHVAPADGRLPETAWRGEPETWAHGQQFLTQVDFPTREFWSVRLVVSSEQAGHAVERQLVVEVTPPGYGPVDLLLYLWPFLAVAFLWIKAMTRRRAVLAASPNAPPDAPSAVPPAASPSADAAGSPDPHVPR